MRLPLLDQRDMRLPLLDQRDMRLPLLDQRDMRLPILDQRRPPHTPGHPVRLLSARRVCRW